MAETRYNVKNISPSGVSTFSEEDKQIVSSFEVNSLFNFATDRVESYILSLDGEILEATYNYENYSFLQGSTTGQGVGASEITLNPTLDIQIAGYPYGGVQIAYNFLNDLYTDNKSQVQFYVAEISPDRTEVRLLTTFLTNEQVSLRTANIKRELESTSYFNDFKLNFKNNVLVTGVNIDTQPYRDYTSVIVKLYRPLPEDIVVKTLLTLDRVVSDSLVYEIEGEYAQDEIPVPYLKGPNFSIELDSGNTLVPSQYFNYNELYGFAPENSYRELNSLFAEKGVNISIDYSNYSDFIHFSSANERLRNFKYKLDLLESYQQALNSIESGSNTAAGISGSRVYYTNLINSVVQNFDHYDRHLYYESGSTSWPKVNSTKPYVNATGSITGSWYNTELASTTTYDYSNVNQLLNTIPSYLREDPNNQQLEIYIHMLAQHFDNLWIYTKAVTDKYDNDNRLNKGLSRDLVEDALRNFGVKLYTSNKSLQDLFKNFTGQFYASGSEVINTFITGSTNPTSEERYRQEVYKRLYHNLPLLTKGKGTERGLRALINSFGIPTLYSSGSHTGLLVKTAGGTNTVSNVNLGPGLINSSSLDKIRLDNTGSVIPGNTLSQYSSVVKRTQVYSDDIHTVDIGYSPSDAINNELQLTLASTGFNIDDYIGDPSKAYDSSYDTLISAANTYVSQSMVSGSHDLQDFTRILKFYDNVVFKMVKDFLPARSSVSSGVIIKPHALERSKAKQVSINAVQNIANSTSSYFDGDITLEGNITSGSRSGSHAGMFTGVEEYSAAYSESVMTLHGPMLLDYHTHEEAKFDGELSGSYLVPSIGELNDENIWKYENPNAVLYSITAVYDCKFEVSAGAEDCSFSVNPLATPTPTPTPEPIPPTATPTPEPDTPTPTPTPEPDTPTPTPTPEPDTPTPTPTPEPDTPTPTPTPTATPTPTPSAISYQLMRCDNSSTGWFITAPVGVTYSTGDVIYSGGLVCYRVIGTGTFGTEIYGTHYAICDPSCPCYGVC